MDVQRGCSLHFLGSKRSQDTIAIMAWFRENKTGGESMKKIEAIIDPSKMKEVKNALTRIGIQRMTISRVDEFGRQEAHKEFYREKEFMVDIVEEFKIELIVREEMLNQIVETIEEKGNIGDEEILVSPLEKVTRSKGGRDEKNRSHYQAV